MLYAFQFQYSGKTIEAAQDANGKIYIAAPTIENLLNIRSNSTREIVASKGFKAFVGNDFQLGKLNSKSTKHENVSNTYYPKETFLKIVYFELQKANQTAINLVVSGFVADFEGRLQYALGKQLTQDELEYTRTLVRERLDAFKAWTTIIRDRHIELYSCKPEGWYYGKLVKKANLALFGCPDFGSDRTKNMSKEEQLIIRDFERTLLRKSQKYPKMNPEDLLTLAIEAF